MYNVDFWESSNFTLVTNFLISHDLYLLWLRFRNSSVMLFRWKWTDDKYTVSSIRCLDFVRAWRKIDFKNMKCQPKSEKMRATLRPERVVRAVRNVRRLQIPVRIVQYHPRVGGYALRVALHNVHSGKKLKSVMFL